MWLNHRRENLGSCEWSGIDHSGLCKRWAMWIERSGSLSGCVAVDAEDGCLWNGCLDNQKLNVSRLHYTPKNWLSGTYTTRLLLDKFMFWATGDSEPPHFFLGRNNTKQNYIKFHTRVSASCPKTLHSTDRFLSVVFFFFSYMKHKANIFKANKILFKEFHMLWFLPLHIKVILVPLK